MRRLVMMAAAMAVSASLAAPAMAAGGAGAKSPGNKPEVAGKGGEESQGKRLHKATATKRDEARKRRDAGQAVRKGHMTSNSPGKTGL